MERGKKTNIVGGFGAERPKIKDLTAAFLD